MKRPKHKRGTKRNKKKRFGKQRAKSIGGNQGGRK